MPVSMASGFVCSHGIPKRQLCQLRCGQVVRMSVPCSLAGTLKPEAVNNVHTNPNIGAKNEVLHHEGES